MLTGMCVLLYCSTRENCVALELCCTGFAGVCVLRCDVLPCASCIVFSGVLCFTRQMCFVLSTDVAVCVSLCVCQHSCQLTRWGFAAPHMSGLTHLPTSISRLGVAWCAQWCLILKGLLGMCVLRPCVFQPTSQMASLRDVRPDYMRGATRLFTCANK